MKHIIHTPTEQYGFVESEFEHDDSIGSEDIIGEHRALVTLAKAGADAVGMDTKEFNSVLDEFLLTGKIAGDPGMMEAMNAEQQAIIQAIKRSRKRKPTQTNKEIEDELEEEYQELSEVVPGPGKGENGDYSGMS